MHVIGRIDDLGKPAWIALMVLGFILWWPIGLAILAFIIWSRRMWSGPMGCGWQWRRGDVEEWRQRAIDRVNRAADAWEHRRARWEERMQRRGYHGEPGSPGRSGRFSETGNRAFDEYRAEALRKLEEEAGEFRAFLERLRMAKDRAEFDEYMKERKSRPIVPTNPGPADDPQAPPQT